MTNNDKKAPLISIITINFNDANGLRRTIESLKTQTFDDYEHIIIDGGSSDVSEEVIKEYLNDANYSKHITYWCSEKDKGIYNAMNKGIRHVNGKYVYMLNSGDLLVSESLQMVAPYLIKNDDCVLHGAIDHYKDGVYWGTISHTVDELKTMMLPHQGLFIASNLHKKYGLYNEEYKIAADRELLIRLKKENATFIHIPVIVCIFNLDGISSNANKLKKEEYQKINNSFYPPKRIWGKRIIHIIRVTVELLLPGIISIPLIKLLHSVRTKKD